MANICTNILTITPKDGSSGARFQLHEFVDAHRRIVEVSPDTGYGEYQVQELDGKEYIVQDFNRSHLLPQPAEYHRINGLPSDDPQFEEITNWREENWGGLLEDALLMEHSLKKLVYRIESTWTPITPYLAKIYSKFPLLVFENEAFGEEGERSSDRFASE